MEPFVDLRVSDLVTFITVQRTRSVSAASRELGVTPSQVSKAIARLERKLKTKLLTRGARGVALTQGGRDVIPTVAAAVETLRRLEGGRSRAGARREVTFVAPSYLASSFGPAIARAQPGLRLRCMEAPPSEIRANLSENAFDMALATGEVSSLPGTWTGDRIGKLRLVLLGPPRLARALGTLPTTTARVRELPFVVPIVGPRSLSPIDDGCPLTRHERKVAHEAQTIVTALEMAAATESLVYGPRLAARRLVAASELVEIPVRDWNATVDLFLLSAADRVLDRTRRSVRDGLRALPELD